MIEVASAVVQVVTSGTDWPATATAISASESAKCWRGAGGAVGLAGIVFGARQSSRRTIGAEDQRARLAEKRRIYANFLTTCAEFVETTISELQASPSGIVSSQVAEGQAAALTNAIGVYSELEIMAPIQVHKPAGEYLRSLMRREDGPRQLVIDSMRTDMGEPVEHRPIAER